ncbi:MAG: hypothetical protein ACI90U_000485 [Pseudomonadales bacterium]|jgi:hypothetical protein
MFDNTVFGYFIIAVVFTLTPTGVAAASERDIDIARQVIEQSVNGKVLSMEQIKTNKVLVNYRFTVLTDSGVVRIFIVSQAGEVIKEV